MLTTKTILRSGVAATLWLCVAGMASAAVSEEEARALGENLTKFGAERAGNADGSIPPYTGGLGPQPEYDRETDDVYVDPFADEKPLYSVTFENMTEYEDLLTEGTKAMLRKYPDTYRAPVYPTHRSMRYLDWIEDNTLKNATTAELTGEVPGDAIKGADENGLPFAGIPFPIPKNGYEVMWNTKLAFAPPVVAFHVHAYLVDSTGGVNPLPDALAYYLRPWYDTSGYLREKTGGAVRALYARLTSPPRSAGITFLNFYTPDAEGGGQQVWFYNPGQRRVRRAPDFAYDLPIVDYGGTLNWDELWGYAGRMDRFEFKLLGKEEKLVPYNAFMISNTYPTREYIGKEHTNPDALRFEKHRVWIVEATRKPSARHVYQKRVFYIDEDAWHITAADVYDDEGNLWRTFQSHAYPSYNTGGMDNMPWIFHDVQKGNYTLLDQGVDGRGYWRRNYIDPEEIKALNIPLTAREVERLGIR